MVAPIVFSGVAYLAGKYRRHSAQKEHDKIKSEHHKKFQEIFKEYPKGIEKLEKHKKMIEAKNLHEKNMQPSFALITAKKEFTAKKESKQPMSYTSFFLNLCKSAFSVISAITSRSIISITHISNRIFNG